MLKPASQVSIESSIFLVGGALKVPPPPSTPDIQCIPHRHLCLILFHHRLYTYQNSLIATDFNKKIATVTGDIHVHAMLISTCVLSYSPVSCRVSLTCFRLHA